MLIYLLKFQDVKFFVTLFCEAYKLDTHMDNGLIYCVHQIQAARIYLLRYCFLFSVFIPQVYEVYRGYIVIPPIYKIYRGYIVFVFSVTMFVCKLFCSSKISQELLNLGF